MNKIIVDHVGHTILGELASEDSNSLKLKNPVIIAAQPTQSGQLQVQLVPLIFREFLNEATRGSVTFTYNKNRIVLVDAEVDEKLAEQYKRMTDPSAVIAQATEGKDQEVVKLFDE